jgi:anti-anti-sigma regulatory factor
MAPEIHHQPPHSLLLHDASTSAVRRLEALVAEAVARGDKVLHLHVGTDQEALTRLTSWLPERISETGRLELVGVRGEREATGGRHEQVLERWRARVRAARDAGYAGVTISSDSGALLEVVRDPDELLALERALHELAGEPGTTVLCCYPLEATTALRDDLPARLAAVHFERTHDELWAARARGGIFCLEGELEASNADRVRAVLEAALAAAMHTIDLRAVTYASPEAIDVLRTLADTADGHGETVRLIRVPAIVERALAVSNLLVHPGLAVHPTDPPATGPGDPSGNLKVAEVLGELSRLEEATNEAEATAGLARILADVIPAADHLSVTVGEPANPRVIDSTDQQAQKLDGLQMQAEEGPCQSAWETGSMVHTPDLRTDVRWPILTDLSREADVMSVLALPVAGEGGTAGVINAYSSRAGAFSQIDVAVAELAAFAVGQVFRHVNQTRELNDMIGNLRNALTSRSVIDQAKGILMCRHGYSPDEAFTALSTASQQQNVKLRELAALLVAEAVED